MALFKNSLHRENKLPPLTPHSLLLSAVSCGVITHWAFKKGVHNFKLPPQTPHFSRLVITCKLKPVYKRQTCGWLTQLQSTREPLAMHEGRSCQRGSRSEVEVDKRMWWKFIKREVKECSKGAGGSFVLIPVNRGTYLSNSYYSLTPANSRCHIKSNNESKENMISHKE